MPLIKPCVSEDYLSQARGPSSVGPSAYQVVLSIYHVVDSDSEVMHAPRDVGTEAWLGCPPVKAHPVMPVAPSVQPADARLRTLAESWAHL